MVLQPEDLVEPRPPQVGVDDQGSLPGPGQGHSQVGRQGRFSITLLRAGNLNDLAGIRVLPEEDGCP